MRQRLRKIEEFWVRNLGNLVLREVNLIKILDFSQLCSKIFSGQILVNYYERLMLKGCNLRLREMTEAALSCTIVGKTQTAPCLLNILRTLRKPK